MRSGTAIEEAVRTVFRWLLQQFFDEFRVVFREEMSVFADEFAAVSALDPDRPLYQGDVARYLGVSQRTLKRWVADGRFPDGAHLADNGKTSFWTRDDVISYLRDRREGRFESLEEGRPTDAMHEPCRPEGALQRKSDPLARGRADGAA